MTAPITNWFGNPAHPYALLIMAGAFADADYTAKAFAHGNEPRPPGQLWERIREHSEQRPKPKWFRPFPIQEVVDTRLGET